MKPEDVLRIGRKRYDEAVEADYENRLWAASDLEFVSNVENAQWPAEERQAREAEGRPCISVNLVAGHVRQVTGSIRQVNPAIKVTPGDGEASDEVAEILGGMIRQIEADSGATWIYESAAERAAAGTMGFWRVLTRYVDDNSFDQEIYLEGIPNSFAVHCDPLAKHPTRKDARYWFISEEMSEEEFEAEYPDAPKGSWDAGYEFTERWETQNTITVCEYMWKEPVKRRLVMLKDGRSVIDPPKGVRGTKERMVDSHRIMWAKMTAGAILEGPTELPGRYFGIVAVMGEELHLGNRVVRSSVVRHAKQAQMLYNYGRTALAESLAIQPKAPFLLTARQVEGFEGLWREANRVNTPYLVYNPDPDAPAPQRQMPPVMSQGFLQEIMVARDDVKATTGIYDANLGAQGNETSGRAIRQRQIEGDKATSIYVDNLALAIEQCGRILVDLIPRIYDTERMVRVLGQDGAETMEIVNGLQISQDGVIRINPLAQGKYTVRVTTGPAYATLRQEMVEGMVQLSQTLGPQAALALGDLIAKNTDWPGADEAAERIRRMIGMAMPGVIEEDEPSPEQQMQMQQAQAAQAQQMQMQQAAFEADMAEKAAKVEKTRAEADGIAVETAAKSFELALASGQLDGAIQAAVARALQGAMAPGPM
jgi:hypothetical protein